VKLVFLVIGIAFFAAVSMAQKYPCLQSDVREDSVVSSVTRTSSKGVNGNRQVTVAQILKKLKARCSRGKLIDGKGKQIYFFRLQGCWGNPPADYLEILDNQRKEIGKLKKKYTVVEMKCDTAGVPLKLIP